VTSLAVAEAVRTGADLNTIQKWIQILDGKDGIREVTNTGGASGNHGYLNRRSGWADADAAMRYGRHKLEAFNRVTFVYGTVSRLLFSQDRKAISGAVLEDGREIRAAMTVLAAGAWSPMLIDLRGRVMATGQVVTYLDISDEEAEMFSQTPVQLNMSTGMFVIPPPAPSQQISYPDHARRLYLKIARHGFGYLHYVTIPHPEDPAQPPITISVPHTNPKHKIAAQPIPQEGIAACREFVNAILDPKSSITTRPFSVSRICHYADTPTGDFIIDYHPKYGKSLFLATGGNGHAFKFLPVVGEKIVDCILGKCPEEFKTKWCWPEANVGEWKGDGSRGGRRGMILAEELEKGRSRL
jgi:sarcosine oxidase / L-pipecolate oxidase